MDHSKISVPKEVIPGAGSLIEHVDKRIFVWLRDGHMYVGILRSVDLFANLVLHNASERIQIGDNYADIHQGIMVVRGENVALLGEMGEDHGNRQDPESLLEAQVAQDKIRKKIEKLRVEANLKRGIILSPEDYF